MDSTCIHPVTQPREDPALELDAHPGGLNSLRKLLRGFCGGASLELPPDDHSERGVKSRQVLPSDVCVETVSLNSSVASEEKPALPPQETVAKEAVKTVDVQVFNEAASEESIEVVKRELPGVGEKEGGTEETKLEEEETNVAEEKEASVEEETAVKEKPMKEESKKEEPMKEEPNNDSFRMMSFLCLTFVAVIVTLWTVRRLDGDFRLEFGQKDLPTSMQQAIENELVNEIVKDVTGDSAKSSILASLEEAYATQEEMEEDVVEEVIKDSAKSWILEEAYATQETVESWSEPMSEETTYEKEETTVSEKEEVAPTGDEKIQKPVAFVRNH